MHHSFLAAPHRAGRGSRHENAVGHRQIRVRTHIRMLEWTASPRPGNCATAPPLPDAIFGQLLPPQTGSVSAHVAAGLVTDARADEMGFFPVRPMPKGAFRLRCRAHAAPTSSLAGSAVGSAIR